MFLKIIYTLSNAHVGFQPRVFGQLILRAITKTYTFLLITQGPFNHSEIVIKVGGKRKREKK